MRRSSAGSRNTDRGSLVLIAILWWVGISAAFALSFFLPQTSILWERKRIFVAGVLLLLGGTAFRWYSARILGKYFTFDVTTHEAHVLVYAGPYRYVRHPSYTGALISLAGLGLALGNWASLMVAIGCLSIAYIYRIAVEEAALITALGDSYKSYMQRTWRLIPFLF